MPPTKIGGSLVRVGSQPPLARLPSRLVQKSTDVVSAAFSLGVKVDAFDGPAKAVVGM